MDVELRRGRVGRGGGYEERGGRRRISGYVVSGTRQAKDCRAIISC